MFINLHTHDCKGSIRDAIAKPKDINKRVKELGQLGYAITNHGSTSSLLTHYNLCRKNGLKFVFGLEAYITDNIFVKERGDYKHICLFAKNITGYKNILKLATISYDKGFYYKPRIDWDLLIKYKEGLIIGSACMGGILGIEDTNGQWNINAMSSTIEKYKKEFGDDFYIEIHTNQMPEQISMNKALYNLCKFYNVQPLATCDSHYVYQDEAWIHKKWLGIDSENEENSYYTTNDFYIHSEDEVRKDLSYMDKDFIEKSIQNTVKVLNDCNVEIVFGEDNFPIYKCESQLEKVKEICRIGWRNKIMHKIPKSEQHKYLDELLHEFDVLGKCNYFNLMLITWDYINQCREKYGIRFGTGRGSVGGSLVAYLMGITEVDPIQHNLSFFRFCNPERVTTADIDVDVEQRNRGKVIDYLREKYGYVYQVRTFTAMQPKASMQRACQCLNIPVKLQKELSKMIIEGETGVEAYRDIPLNQTNKPIVELATVFQGIISNTGVHASAVLVFPKDPTEFCALERQGDMLVCAYDYHELEELGLAKVDVLGLKNMDIIQDTLNLIHEINPEFDLTNIPLDDKNTYDLLCDLKSDGVFQIESNMMKGLIKDIQPRRFEDVYAIVSLGRPAVLQAGLHTEFIKEKRIAENERGTI